MGGVIFLDTFEIFERTYSGWFLQIADPSVDVSRSFQDHRGVC